jgi:hypothetical protein
VIPIFASIFPVLAARRINWELDLELVLRGAFKALIILLLAYVARWALKRLARRIIAQIVDHQAPETQLYNLNIPTAALVGVPETTPCGGNRSADMQGDFVLANDAPGQLQKLLDSGLPLAEGFASLAGTLGQADLVLKNAAVYTMDGMRSWADAVAVEGGKIGVTTSGERVQARNVAGETAELVGGDLELGCGAGLRVRLIDPVVGRARRGGGKHERHAQERTQGHAAQRGREWLRHDVLLGRG